jgi:hypothetical protein
MQPYRWFGEALIFCPTCDPGGAPMPDQRLLALARECRERAEEILVKTETFRDANAREGMRRIAGTYVELAERLERAARD